MPQVEGRVDKYNLDITITLDTVFDEYDYRLLLLDKRARLLGVGKSNGNGGKSITIPNWCMGDEGYTLKVQTMEGNDIVAEERYQLSFRENTLHMEYMKMCERMSFPIIARRKLLEKQMDMSAYKLRQYEDRYMEQMEMAAANSKEYYA